MKNVHNYRFFTHRKCEYFPCHSGISEDDFNCLFCYCPLYALKEECGGDFFYNDTGIKNCSNCAVPHKRENFDRIIDGCNKLIKICSEKCENG
jgi:Zn-finger protein